VASDQKRSKWNPLNLLQPAGITAAGLFLVGTGENASAAAPIPLRQPPAKVSKDDLQQVAALIQEIQIHLKYMGEVTRKADKKEIDGHIKDLGSEVYREREKATQALKEIGYQAGPELKAASKSPDLEVARRANDVLESLRHIDDLRAKKLQTPVAKLASFKAAAKGAVPILIEVLSQPNAEIRDTATETLGEIGPGAAPAVPLMLNQLKSTDPEVWRNTAIALGKVGPAAKDAAPLLLKTLRNPAPDFDFEPMIMEVLGNMRAEEAIDDIIRVMDNCGSTHTKVTGAIALTNIGKQPKKVIPALDRCYHDSSSNARDAGFAALLQFKSEPALLVPILVKTIEGRNLKTEIIASIKTLAEMGEAAKAALPALKNLRDSKSTEDEVTRWGQATADEIRRQAGAAVEAIEKTRGR